MGRRYSEASQRVFRSLLLDAEQRNPDESCGGVGRNPCFNIPPQLPILGRLHLRFRRKDYRREMFRKKTIRRTLEHQVLKNQPIKTVKELSEATMTIAQNYNRKLMSEDELIAYKVNRIEGDVMDRKLIDQWQKDFHEVVESLDVEKYKAFYRMYQDNVYGGRPMPKSDKVIMAAMCKVALELTTISEPTKKKADEWLEANNFAKGIWR